VAAVGAVAGGLVGTVAAAYLLAFAYVRPAALAAFAASGRLRDGLHPRRVGRVAGSGTYATAWLVAAATLGAGYTLAGPFVPLVVGVALVFVVHVAAHGLYGRGAATALEVVDAGDEDGVTDPTAAEAVRVDRSDGPERPRLPRCRRWCRRGGQFRSGGQGSVRQEPVGRGLAGRASTTRCPTGPVAPLGPTVDSTGTRPTGSRSIGMESALTTPPAVSSSGMSTSTTEKTRIDTRPGRRSGMRISDRGYGEEGRERLTLVPENVDDLWHLAHVLEPGDLVEGDTTRRIQRNDDQMRDTGGQREHLFVTLQVDEVEFARFANRLRVSGVIVGCSREDQLNAHHTINVEEHDEITVEKHFKPDQTERLEEATEAAENPDVAIATVEEGPPTSTRSSSTAPRSTPRSRSRPGRATTLGRARSCSPNWARRSRISTPTR